MRAERAEEKFADVTLFALSVLTSSPQPPRNFDYFCNNFQPSLGNLLLTVCPRMSGPPNFQESCTLDA